MATTGTTVINDVLSRIRDANAQLVATDNPPTSTTGRAFVLTLINHATIFINLGEDLLVNTQSLTLTANTAIYDLTSVGASDYGGKVVGCTVTNEVDGPVDYRALGRANRSWPNANVTDITVPLSWAPIGNTLLAFYPTFASTPPAVTVRYVTSPAFLAAEASNVAIPDIAVEHLARLTELLARIKTRQLTAWDERIQRLAKDMGVRLTLGKAPAGSAD